MLRSLFSGISSLRSHQTMLDVTGNNIANANTTGFKSSRTQFEDTLSQMLQAPGAPQDANGGTNPAQVGLGVRVAGITTDITTGAAQQTGRGLDMMINGDGFFVLQSGAERLFTRNGAFTLDALGRVVNASGAFIQGWSADANGTINRNGQIGNITIPVTTTMGAQATETITLSGNLPSDATLDDPATPESEATSLEREIEVYGADGTATTVGLRFTMERKDVTGATWTVAWSSGVDAAGEPVFTNLGTMTFDGNGELGAPPAFTIPVNDPPIALDLGGVTGYASLTTIEASGQDGQGAGVLQSYEMNADGTLMGAFSNGMKQAIGQVALASFANAAGLEKAGESSFRATVNSGAEQIGVAGEGGRGALTGGALEMSNVDLSAEFTNLIIAQRGYQAGSRVITTSDELLQELVNLKR